MSDSLGRAGLLDAAQLRAPAETDERAVLYQQLLAIRAQVDAMLTLLEGPQRAPELCPHPVERRKYLGSTMGDLSFRCTACGGLGRDAATLGG